VWFETLFGRGHPMPVNNESRISKNKFRSGDRLIHCEAARALGRATFLSRPSIPRVLSRLRWLLPELWGGLCTDAR